MAETPPLNNLPEPSTRLIGWQREIDAVRQLLSGSRLLTLTGPAGGGKTRLALALARAVLPEFRDGVWLIELAPLAEPEWLTQTVAWALGVREAPEQPPYPSLRDHLRPRHVLLVLDGVDLLHAECARLAESLLADCPQLQILVTSRAPVKLVDAVNWPVPPLSLPGAEPAPSERCPRCENGEELGSAGEATGPDESDAVSLFIERASAARPDFALTAENTAAVARLCCRLEGNPLAIELAAGWTPWLPPQQVLLEMDRHEADMTRRRRGQPGLKPLHLLLSWCIHYLTEEERRLLRRLAVFEGGFTPTAARSVCGRGGMPESEVTKLLQQLEQRSLVVKRCETNPQGGVRYHLPEAVRQHARQLLEQSREVRVQRRLHHEWYLSLTYRDETASEGEGLEAWLAQMESDQHNLRAALRWCHEQRDRPALWRYAANLAQFWQSHDHWSEGESRLTQLQGRKPAATGENRSSSDPVQVPGRWSYVLQLCFEVALCALPLIALIITIGLSMLLGRNYWAFTTLVMLVLLGSGTLFSAARGHLITRSFAMCCAGVFVEARGNPAAARRMYQRSLALDRLLFDRRSAVRKQLYLGHLEFRVGDTVRAKVWYEAAVATARRLRWKEGVSEALAALGQLHHHEELQPRYEAANALLTDGFEAYLKGEFGAARARFEDALVAWQDLDEMAGVIGAQRGPAFIDLAQGRYDAARAGLEVCRSLAIQHDLEASARSILIDLGTLARSLGQRNAARVRLEQAMALAQRHGERNSEAIVLLNHGEIDLSAGELDAAAERFTRALTIGQELNDERLIALALADLGRLARRRGHPDEARVHCQDSLRRFQELGYRPEIAGLLEELAGVAADEGDPETAARLWGAGAALRDALGTPLLPVELSDCERDVAAARAVLGDAAFTGAWEAGRTEPLEQVVARVLERSQSATREEACPDPAP